MTTTNKKRYNYNMKKVNEIISHLFSPYENKFNQYRCLKKIISLLPLKYNKYISSMVLKGEVLYINVTHPAIRQELFYKRDLIFTITKELHKHNQCIEINPKKIVTNFRYKKPQKITKITKKPTAKGTFKIITKNEEIKKIFEEIKKELNARYN